jgi:hypothetical protein
VGVFIAGLVVGPALALVAGETLVRLLGRWWSALVVVLVLFALIFWPFFSVQLELKLGLAAGLLLGLLLSATPYELELPLDAEPS